MLDMAIQLPDSCTEPEFEISIQSIQYFMESSYLGEILSFLSRIIPDLIRDQDDQESRGMRPDRNLDPRSPLSAPRFREDKFKVKQ